LKAAVGRARTVKFVLGGITDERLHQSGNRPQPRCAGTPSTADEFEREARHTADQGLVSW
jgi:hypothetical protein